MGAKQRFQLVVQLRVSFAGLLQEWSARGWHSFQRLRERLSNVLFSFQIHACPVLECARSPGRLPRSPLLLVTQAKKTFAVRSKKPPACPQEPGERRCKQPLAPSGPNLVVTREPSVHASQVVVRKDRPRRDARIACSGACSPAVPPVLAPLFGRLQRIMEFSKLLPPRQLAFLQPIIVRIRRIRRPEFAGKKSNSPAGVLAR